MTMPVFDTLAYARRMEAVGFTRQQAEALAEEQSKLIDERLATKTDIELVRKDIDLVRSDTKAEFELFRKDMRELELRMTIKLGTIVTAIVAVFSALTHFWH